MLLKPHKNIRTLAFCLIISACTPVEKEQKNTVKSEVTEKAVQLSEDEKIALFFEDIFNENVASSPEYQTSLGIKTEDYGKWDDSSDEYYLNTFIQERKNQLARLKDNFDYQSLNDTNKLSYDLFVFNAERSIENAAWYRHHYVVDQFNGQVTNKIAFIQNNHKIDNVSDAEAYIQRLNGIDKVFVEFAKQLNDRAEFAVITPEFSFPDMIKDIGNLKTSDPKSHILYLDFSDKLNALEISQVEKATLKLEAEQAIAGPFQTGVETLLDQIVQIQAMAKGNNGVWALPNGEEFYGNRIKYHTTLDLTADEIHQIGLDDVARIHKEMREIMKEVHFEGSLQEFFAFVRNDPNNFYEDSDAGREAFLAEARQSTADIFAIADQYFNKLPKADLEVRRVEPWRENSTSIAFYNRPSLDGSRPGRYYANLKDMKNLQKYVFSAITYHEGVPGHHFQIALAQELEDLPKFRKFSGYGAYTEGWALYAEQLAREMGFYKDPMYNFGRLQDEIWRSVRLVTDTGIHSKKWTREQAIQYFMENTPISEGDIVTEVERYFVLPGQALGYKLGMITILALREKAKAALGDKFDIKDFHDVVIGTGALPLPILTKQVDKYIAANSIE
ncbi:DUF885 domain-containing protein [Paraglaciecola marina]|uniref:DUF885 domain-containing protein n=1 Tax=Paraglaciecola marina TaxID=2500157 RepID=UPI00106086DF|nr:DUF885 domain-containing protein [Paraglaciecola marina]